MTKFVPFGLLVALFTTLSPAIAQGSTAHEVVRTATMEVMAVVAEAQEYADDDPERYYGQVLAVLDPVVDFRGFARSVMGPYASSERYRGLDESGRAQLRAQLDDFTEVIRSGLIRTYSKGLLAFGGSRIEVSETSPDEAQQSRVSVQQLIYSDATEPYMVMYQMGRNKQGEWKLRNMIIESVNLGEIYRSQFEASAREYDGDLDQVIAAWSTEALET